MELNINEPVKFNTDDSNTPASADYQAAAGYRQAVIDGVAKAISGTCALVLRALISQQVEAEEAFMATALEVYEWGEEKNLSGPEIEACIQSKLDECQYWKGGYFIPNLKAISQDIKLPRVLLNKVLKRLKRELIVHTQSNRGTVWYYVDLGTLDKYAHGKAVDA